MTLYDRIIAALGLVGDVPRVHWFDPATEDPYRRAGCTLDDLDLLKMVHAATDPLAICAAVAKREGW